MQNFELVSLDKPKHIDRDDLRFHNACAQGDIEECEKLYKSNSSYLNRTFSQNYISGIHFAVQNNHINVVKWLLQNNADLYIDDSKEFYIAVNRSTGLFDASLKSFIVSNRTPFAVCKNAEIYCLLEDTINDKLSNFDILQQSVICCEMIISLLKQDEKNIELATKLLEKIQGILGSRQNYNCNSVIALNAAAKAFFNVKAYNQAELCLKIVNVPHSTRAYTFGRDYKFYSLKFMMNCVNYNLIAIQLKIQTEIQATTQNEFFANQLNTLGDTFSGGGYNFEAKQCYKKLIHLGNQENKELLAKVYMKLIKIQISDLNFSKLFPEENKEEELLEALKKIQTNLAKSLDIATQIPTLDESFAIKLQEMFSGLFSYEAYKTVEEYCNKFIALNNKNNDKLWIYLDIHLIKLQLATKTEIEYKTLDKILNEIPTIATEVDNSNYWNLLNLVYGIGKLFSENEKYIEAQRCYEIVFNTCDNKRHEDCNEDEDVYLISGFALIKTQQLLKIKTTKATLDKFLKIEIEKGFLDHSGYSGLELWKDAGDLFFREGKYDEAEQCYKRIFDLFYVTNWKGYGDDPGPVPVPGPDIMAKDICAHIKVAINLIETQMNKGIKINTTVDKFFEKVTEIIATIRTEELEEFLALDPSKLFVDMSNSILLKCDRNLFAAGAEFLRLAYEIALKSNNHNNCFARVLISLKTYYKMLGEDSKFIEYVVFIFLPGKNQQIIAPSQCFNNIYLSCNKAVASSNILEMQLFKVTLEYIETTFINSVENANDNDILSSRKIFFKQNDNRARFVDLYNAIKEKLSVQPLLQQINSDKSALAHILIEHRNIINEQREQIKAQEEQIKSQGEQINALMNIIKNQQSNIIPEQKSDCSSDSVNNEKKRKREDSENSEDLSETQRFFKKF